MLYLHRAGSGNLSCDSVEPLDLREDQRSGFYKIPARIRRLPPFPCPWPFPSKYLPKPTACFVIGKTCSERVYSASLRQLTVLVGIIVRRTPALFGDLALALSGNFRQHIFGPRVCHFGASLPTAHSRMIRW